MNGSMPDRRGPRGPGGLTLVIVMIVALAAAGAAAFWFGQGGAATVGGPFTLTDGEGKAVTQKDFRGRYMLVYFGYTFCPDICPTTLNQVAEAMDRLGAKAGRVVPIFITIDPARDTVPVMKKYVASFSPKLIGLTGTPAEIADVAKEYRVYYAVHKTGAGPGDYTMDHSSILYLMDPEGRFLAPIPADDSGADIATAISRYVTS